MKSMPELLTAGAKFIGISIAFESTHKSKEILRGSTYPLSGWGSLNEDKVIEGKGIEVYRDMPRDAEVAADVDLRLIGMMPGAQIIPADTDEDAKRAAELVDAVMTRMNGSLLDVLRDQMLREAIETGFLVAEPVQAKIDLPTFGGKVIGLDSLKVRPSENFTDNIKMDDHGNIEYFQQGIGSNKKVTLDQIIYYAFRGRPWNPYGRSIYHSAYDYWYLKQTLTRLFAVFCTVNASGIREMELPDDLFKQDSAAAMVMLKKLGEYASIVRKKSQKLTLHIPPGTAGYHFIRGIRELCNAEIRKAILYDETINASSQEGILSDNKAVAQSNVYGSMLAQGHAYCESIAEQLFRRILNWNGFVNWPTPKLVPEPIVDRNADAVPILDALTRAWQSGFLTDVPEELKDQVLRQVVRPIGVDHDESAPEPDADENKKDIENQQYRAASAPRGRTHADLMKLKREAIIAEKAGQVKLVDTWKSNLPALKKKLNNVLFDSAGHWKTKDYANVRKAVEENITTGGSSIRKVMTDMAVDRYDKGYSDAGNMIPVRAAVLVTPVMITPAAARKMLSQHIYLTMGKDYKIMTDKIYYILENAINGGISEREAMAELGRYLTDHGITAGRATTIVNTSLGQAYNQGRMSLFNQLSDPDGLTPGGIIGYMYSAVMDDATTDICQEYDGLNFRVDDPSLPTELLHYDCRRVLLPIFSGEEPWNGKGWTSQNDSKILYDRTADMPGSFRKAG